jgi:hypothetical protein
MNEEKKPNNNMQTFRILTSKFMKAFTRIFTKTFTRAFTKMKCNVRFGV